MALSVDSDPLRTYLDAFWENPNLKTMLGAHVLLYVPFVLAGFHK
jgi:hypothetical protein